MRPSRRIGVALVLVALIALVAGTATWQLTRTPRVALGPLSIVIPAACDRTVYASGDAGTGVVLLYLPNAFGTPCLVLQERSESIDDLLAQSLDSASPEAVVEPQVATACGPAIRIRDGQSTTYLLRRGDSSWIVAFDVPDDTMATCSMAG
jgi:hypothetical protein